MKTIKEIKIEDCVECYVDDTHTPAQNSIKKVIIGSYLGNRFIDVTGARWKYAIPCEQLDNQLKPKWSDKYPKEWSIDAKIFKALSEGAVIKYENNPVKIISNDWDNRTTKKYHQICTNYTGTDSDVWEEIE